MKKKEKALFVIEALKKRYPEAKCSLTYKKPYELLIATRLSAQCTDARVNIVTKELFQKFTSLEDFANADIADIEESVRSCGLYKTKAADIKKMSRQLLDNFGGELPETIEELTTLSGIGRKTANLIVGDIYGKPSIVTDTHCIRITNRLGLTKEKEPFKVEKDLAKILPPKESGAFCHRLVHFGREVCTARSPKCELCELKEVCSFKK